MVRLASPAALSATSEGIEIRFEGAIEGLEAGDILYIGDVRILVDRETGAFSQVVSFPTSGHPEVWITVENRGDEVAGRALMLRF